MRLVMAEVPVVRCATCDATYELVAPIMPARWIYQQSGPCKRAKHPLTVMEGVDLATAETLPLMVVMP